MHKADRVLQQNRRLAGAVWRYLLLFALLSVTLFLLSSRSVVVYDEGIALTGAMRVLAGQVPHRDFYYNYGAGTVYLLAGLFRLFSVSVLVERIAGVFASSLLVLSMYALTRRYTARWIAVAATVVGLLWVAMDTIQGLLPPAVCLPILWSTWLLVPVVNPVEQRRTFGAGLLVGALFLLRYDLGVGIACAHLVATALFVLAREGRTSSRVRRIWGVVWPYASGFAAIVAGPAICLSRVAPLHDLLYDVFLFQAKYYRMGRALPLPRVSFDTLPDCIVYVSPLVIGLALYFIAREFWRDRHSERRAALPSSGPAADWLLHHCGDDLREGYGTHKRGTDVPVHHLVPHDASVDGERPDDRASATRRYAA